MRRLVPFVLAIVLLGVTGADAAKPTPLKIVAGTAHAAGTVNGWFVVRNVGETPAARTMATVVIRKGGQSIQIGSLPIPRLTSGERHQVRFSVTAPTGDAAGIWSIEACIRARCRRLGQVTTGGGSPIVTPVLPPTATPPSPPMPDGPISYVAGEPFHHTAGTIEYWGFVPFSYDQTNQTPTPLLIWLHGCGGYSEGDIWVVDPGADPEEPQDWLTLALGGREGECWVPSVDEPKVLAALTNFESHFNVDPRRVILGGYSSGGDLAYRTGFRNSSTFAGLLIENSAPWSETEMSEAESLAASTKFPVVHLAHTGDTTYPIETVREQTEAMIDAGFPVELVERPGGHSDAHTDSDLRTYLLPHMNDGWLAP